MRDLRRLPALQPCRSSPLLRCLRLHRPSTRRSLMPPRRATAVLRLHRLRSVVSSTRLWLLPQLLFTLTRLFRPPLGRLQPTLVRPRPGAHPRTRCPHGMMRMGCLMPSRRKASPLRCSPARRMGQILDLLFDPLHRRLPALSPLHRALHAESHRPRLMSHPPSSLPLVPPIWSPLYCRLRLCLYHVANPCLCGMRLAGGVAIGRRVRTTSKLSPHRATTSSILLYADTMHRHTLFSTRLVDRFATLRIHLASALGSVLLDMDPTSILEGRLSGGALMAPRVPQGASCSRGFRARRARVARPNSIPNP